MVNFILGFLFVPFCYMIYDLTTGMIDLWKSVKKYGGENPRALNWFGKRVQKLFQRLQGKPVDRPKAPGYRQPV